MIKLISCEPLGMYIWLKMVRLHIGKKCVTFLCWMWLEKQKGRGKLVSIVYPLLDEYCGIIFLLQGVQKNYQNCNFLAIVATFIIQSLNYFFNYKGLKKCCFCHFSLHPVKQKPLLFSCIPPTWKKPYMPDFSIIYCFSNLSNGHIQQ